MLMELFIVSGLSGSGKSIVLDTLEDSGYYCIDNLPIALLERFINDVVLIDKITYANTAIGIDARNENENLCKFAHLIALIRAKAINCEVIFIQADEETLLKRYSETRRRHPLSNPAISLREAISLEKLRLEAIVKQANVIIDTSQTYPQQLRNLIRDLIGKNDSKTSTVIQIQSFGFKHGIPLDADFVFDARCLPNPHWDMQLRHLTGNDSEIINFLSKHPLVNMLCQDILDFLMRWLPHFESQGRSYLTIAIGCTGGQHRSVYLVNALSEQLRSSMRNVIIRHRELL